MHFEFGLQNLTCPDLEVITVAVLKLENEAQAREGGTATEGCL